MDFYIDRDELSRGLARVQGIIERRGTFPMLSHVLLHAHSSGLRITATDTEVAYIGELQANIQTSGEIAIDAANLFQVIRALPETTVRITVASNHRVEIRSGRSHFKLPGAVASEYPAIAAFDARGVIRMSEKTLRRLVEQTSFAVAVEEHRFGLNGAHLEEREVSGQKFLRMVATDGHRLSSSEALFEGQISLAPRMLLPRKALGVLRKLLEGDEPSLEISFGEGAIRISRPGSTFWFRLLDGEFPDYDAVVPKENKHKISLSKDELSSALKRVSIVVQDRARPVRFQFQEGELEIQIQSSDRGEVKDTLPAKIEGDSIATGFNIRYLQDILAVIDGPTISLEMAHPLAPCLIKNEESSHAFFVVMPMRLD